MKRFLALSLALLCLIALCACSKKPAVEPSDAETVVQNGVRVETAAFPKDTELKIEVAAAEAAAPLAAVLNEKAEIFAYEITALANGAAVQPDGTVRVTFPIPASYNQGIHDLALYYVPEQGEPELIPATKNPDGLVADLSHFSLYAVVLMPKAQTGVSDPSQNPDSPAQPSDEAPDLPPTPATELVSAADKIWMSVWFDQTQNKIHRTRLTFQGSTLLISHIVAEPADTLAVAYEEMKSYGVTQAASLEAFRAEQIALDSVISYQGQDYLSRSGDTFPCTLTTVDLTCALFYDDGGIHYTLTYQAEGTTLMVVAFQPENSYVTEFISPGQIFTLQ